MNDKILGAIQSRLDQGQSYEQIQKEFLASGYSNDEFERFFRQVTNETKSLNEVKTKSLIHSVLIVAVGFITTTGLAALLFLLFVDGDHWSSTDTMQIDTETLEKNVVSKESNHSEADKLNSVIFRKVEENDFDTYRLPNKSITNVVAVSIVNDKAGIKLSDGSLVYENEIVTNEDNSYFLYGNPDLNRMVYWSGYNPTTVFDGENQYKIDGNFYGFKMIGGKISLLSEKASYFDGELFDTGQMSLYTPAEQQEWVIGTLSDGSVCVSGKKSNGTIAVECDGSSMLKNYNVFTEPLVYKGKLLFIATIYNTNFDLTKSTYEEVSLQNQNLNTKQVLVWGDEIISSEYSAIKDLAVEDDQYFFVGMNINTEKVLSELESHDNKSDEELTFITHLIARNNNSLEVVHDGRAYGSEYDSIKEAKMFNGHAVYIGINSQDNVVSQKDLVIDGEIVFSTEKPNSQNFSLAHGHFAMVDNQPAFIVRGSVPDNYIQYGNSRLFPGTSALKKIFSAEGKLHILNVDGELLVERDI